MLTTAEDFMHRRISAKISGFWSACNTRSLASTCRVLPSVGSVPRNVVREHKSRWEGAGLSGKEADAVLVRAREHRSSRRPTEWCFIRQALSYPFTQTITHLSKLLAFSDKWASTNRWTPDTTAIHHRVRLRFVFEIKCNMNWKETNSSRNKGVRNSNIKICLLSKQRWQIQTLYKASAFVNSIAITSSFSFYSSASSGK